MSRLQRIERMVAEAPQPPRRPLSQDERRAVLYSLAVLLWTVAVVLLVGAVWFWAITGMSVRAQVAWGVTIFVFVAAAIAVGILRG